MTARGRWLVPMVLLAVFTALSLLGVVLSVALSVVPQASPSPTASTAPAVGIACDNGYGVVPRPGQHPPVAYEPDGPLDWSEVECDRVMSELFGRTVPTADEKAVANNAASPAVAAVLALQRSGSCNAPCALPTVTEDAIRRALAGAGFPNAVVRPVWASDPPTNSLLYGVWLGGSTCLLGYVTAEGQQWAIVGVLPGGACLDPR